MNLRRFLSPARRLAALSVAKRRDDADRAREKVLAVARQINAELGRKPDARLQ